MRDEEFHGPTVNQYLMVGRVIRQPKETLFRFSCVVGIAHCILEGVVHLLSDHWNDALKGVRIRTIKKRGKNKIYAKRLSDI